jgi:hypothetical protein
MYNKHGLTSWGKLQQPQEDCPDGVHSDQMVLGTVWQEAGPRERWPKALKTKLTSRGTTRLQSDQIRWFSW